MARRPRHVPKKNTLIEITCRTIQGRMLLRPSKYVKEIIIGVIGRAQRYTSIRINALSVASNHLLCAAAHNIST